MEDNFNLIAQLIYYINRFIPLIKNFKKVSDKKRDYALREMQLLIHILQKIIC